MFLMLGAVPPDPPKAMGHLPVHKTGAIVPIANQEICFHTFSRYLSVRGLDRSDSNNVIKCLVEGDQILQCDLIRRSTGLQMERCYKHCYQFYLKRVALLTVLHVVQAVLPKDFKHAPKFYNVKYHTTHHTFSSQYSSYIGLQLVEAAEIEPIPAKDKFHVAKIPSALLSGDARPRSEHVTVTLDGVRGARQELATYFLPSNNYIYRSTNTALSSQSGDTVFGSFLVTDRNVNFVMDKYNLTSVPSILYHHMGQPAKFYTGSFRPMDLKVFVKGNTAATMMQYTAELTGERFHQYLKMKPTVFVKFVSDKKDAHTCFTELTYNGIAALATDWKNPAVFAKFNVTKYPDVLGNDTIDTMWSLYVYKWGIRYEYQPAENMEQDVAALERLSGDLITTIDHKHDTVTEPGQAETMVIMGMFPKEGNVLSMNESTEV
eukprot:sb/3464875/